MLFMLLQCGIKTIKYNNNQTRDASSAICKTFSKGENSFKDLLFLLNSVIVNVYFPVIYA